jgi:AraC-like DNA-binding protein
VEEGEEAILTCDFVRGSERSNRVSAELVVTGVVITSHRSLGISQPPRGAEFEHDAPAYAPEYQRVLGCPVRFGSDATRVRFDRRLLDVPQIHSNAELFRLLESQADRSLGNLASQGTLSARVRALVIEHYDGTKPTMQAVARRLGVSARSLRRHLHEEGHTYAEVVDGAMADVARRLLYDSTATIQDVADRLGFSEPSAFHRAFKRWTGLTPQQFRARCTGGAEP